MNNYEAVVGLEIHLQVDTAAKAFCSCPTTFGDRQNQNICPVCTGQPGALPALNREFMEKALLFSLALNCDINRDSTFDRKNYFYPDLTKGYQITQFFRPIGENGFVMVKDRDGNPKKIGLERIHMEEDTGKSFHKEGKTLLNYNRAGVPLCEVVSRPDIRTGDEAVQYLKKIYNIAVKYLKICDGNMEEGSLRCDANVSIRKKGETILNEKTEIKNVNSFSFIQKAIDFEIDRQIKLAEEGGSVEPETRLWNAKLKQTEVMRKKAGRNDYRYFNEPDLAPLRIDEDSISSFQKSLPELPDEKEVRVKKVYGLNDELMDLMISYPEVCDYFEKAVAKDISLSKKVAGWISGELLRFQNKENMAGSPVTPEMLFDLVAMIEKKRINQAQGKEVLETMYASGKTAFEIVENDPNFAQIDSSEIEAVIDDVISSNSNQYQAYKNGKKALFGFFMGQVMKKSGGKADPETVKSLLISKLG